MNNLYLIWAIPFSIFFALVCGKKMSNCYNKIGLMLSLLSMLLVVDYGIYPILLGAFGMLHFLSLDDTLKKLIVKNENISDISEAKEE